MPGRADHLCGIGWAPSRGASLVRQRPHRTPGWAGSRAHTQPPLHPPRPPKYTASAPFSTAALSWGQPPAALKGRGKCKTELLKRQHTCSAAAPHMPGAASAGRCITCRRQHLGLVPRQRHHGGLRRQRPVLLGAARSAARLLLLRRRATSCLLAGQPVQLRILALCNRFPCLRLGLPRLSPPRPTLPAALLALAAPRPCLPACRGRGAPAGGTNSRHPSSCKWRS